MDFKFVIEVVIYVLLPAVVGICSWVLRQLMQRIEKLEVKLEKKPDQQEVRMLIEDKLDPIRKDLAEMNELLKEIYRISLKK